MAIFPWFHRILNSTANVLFRCVLRCFRLVFFMVPPRKQINSSTPSSPSSSHSTPPSSSSSSSSSSQFWTHHVFLSFRGTDTRNTFVDHLYSALHRRGIHTYKDDETLPRGETIGPSLFKAIEGSQIAVIVFSENYAESSWCLQELAHIMKCKDEKRQIVMPIFYNVDPSELRKQKGKYGKALAKHRSQNRNVESWRKALVDAGNLSGDVVDGFTRETIFINKFVDTINRLCVAISSENEDLIGIKARLHDLKSKREMESEGVVMVGIWGSGGGGKTTLASSLYDEISSKFDVCCFIENIREESSKFGLPKLQKDILALVLNQTHINRVEDGRCLIKDRFCRKKVVIVLDDVDHLDQLEALAGSHDWFGEGSRIIITTRDMHLLTAHKVNVIYNISLLDPDEAMKLFRKRAPQDGRPLEEYEKLSKEVVSYAGGLPLALKVLGSFLCDKKEMSEWRNALARLKDIPESDIVEKLKISYDGLKPMEKELFLDIACFFKARFKDGVMEILDACGFYPVIGVKVLIEKALITAPEGGVFYMHDLIQEMGHHIVRGENPKNPELHSRVWQWEDVVKICSVDASKENDKIKALHGDFPWDEDIPPNLPRVVGNMKKLRRIILSGYRATSLPCEFQPTNLCYLHLGGSLVEQLWEGYKVLPDLKVINLQFSLRLIKTPNFNGLRCLERLILKGCESLKEIHPSIGYCERLIFLNMGGCRSLEIFPPIVRMKMLETLILSDCSKLCKLPEIQRSMDNLKELCLRGSGIEVVPSSIGENCTNLHSLDVSDCNHLQSIEGNFHHLKHLNVLHLNGCDQLKSIPTEGLFDIECCLQLLSSCTNLHRDMVNLKLFGLTTSLRKLSLKNCNLVDGDVFSVFREELSNLQALDLSENKFSRLHSSLSQLPRLKFLNLSFCNDLVELLELPSSISILRANRCNSLDVIGNFPNNLKWLWNVSLLAKKCNVEHVLQSLLKGNALEDYYIRIDAPYITVRGFADQVFTLQLPLNWKSKFSGFLVYIDHWDTIGGDIITIEEVTGGENKGDILEVSNEDEESKQMSGMFYISFGSLKDTSWWNSTHTTISFSIRNAFSSNVYLKVELVPKKSQGDDSIERPKGPTSCSEFWDEEYQNRKTFEFLRDSNSLISIVHSSRDQDVFDRI